MRSWGRGVGGRGETREKAGCAAVALPAAQTATTPRAWVRPGFLPEDRALCYIGTRCQGIYHRRAHHLVVSPLNAYKYILS